MFNETSPTLNRVGKDNYDKFNDINGTASLNEADAGRDEWEMILLKRQKGNTCKSVRS